MEKSNGSSFTRRIQALELCSPLPKSNQECKEEKQREESNMKKSKRIATVGLISNTFWSPFYVYYMLFRSSGSQESNASNGAQIRAKIKKLWSLEDNGTKLKDNFASCEINLFLRNGHFQFAKFLQVMLQVAKSTCVLPDICDRLF
ncbi:hypothetical protein VitviT2T_028098 [Vitis vinifera]|uniref:Uncharacterized protein n=1 Tax=Vitis vinifera TaxID=29760 RepID=A0ABY9DTY6_VITVI|nr:hypothetical protein VitviT2T_028098 [Vitis vinifera]